MEVPFLLLSAAIFLLLQIVLSLYSTFPLNSTQSPLSSPPQSLALLQFKNHFDITKSADICSEVALPMLQSWREGTNCCLWEGVECEESTGNVIALFLYCLYGQIPTNSSLFELSHLQILDLSHNDFKGSPVPSELGRLVNLQHLDISNSNFSGMIPSRISHLSNLISLKIGDHLYNFQNVYHPIFDSRTFEMLSKNLTHLKYLHLSYLNMSAVNMKSFLNLSTSLESLFLSDCHLHGIFPVNVLRFVNLTDLDVSNNPKLIITLPKFNWRAPLEYLGLCSSNLEGHLPSSIFSLPQLSHLDLSNNELVSLPSSVTPFSKLTYLNLSSNKLTGAIPSWLFNLTSLRFLHLADNQFTGEIPEFQSKSLVFFYLGWNMLRGSIPECMFQLPNLTILSLPSNNLYFGIIELEGFQKLKSLVFLDRVGIWMTLVLQE